MHRIIWFIILFISLFLFACAPQDKPFYLPPHTAEHMKNILVVPFDYYCPTDKESPFYCPVSGIIPGEIEPKAKEVMDKLLIKELSQLSLKYHFLFLSRNEYELLLEEALEKAKTHADIVRFFTEKTNTQVLLYGKIFRFKERQGSSWSISEPASVSFVLTLYDGKTGKILWQKVFDETQKPISENLLNLPLYGKIKWLSAEELAERGLKNILKSFPQ
ncbi:MAG: hypothetical protein ACK4GE_00275 [Caldimicrobium sp.]